MKKYIQFSSAILLAICFTCTSGISQETNKSRFGIKGGVNLSSLYTKDADNDKIRTGFNIGLFSKMPVNDILAIQPELYFTTKGSQVAYNNAFVNGKARFDLNYLELPLLAIVNISKNFNIHVGPYVGYLVSGKVKNESDANVFNFEDNINVDDYNRLDAGLAAGVGIDMGALSIGARYNYGLTKVGKEKTFLGTPYRFPDAVNGVLSFYAAISFQ